MSLLTLVWNLIGLALCLPLIVFLFIWISGYWQFNRARQHQFVAWQNQQRARLDRRDGKVRQRCSDRQSVAETGWKGWRKFRIRQIKQETPLARSLFLEPVDGLPVADFLPGQFLTIGIKLPGDKKPSVRCYSISGREGNCYRITVKKVVRETKNSVSSVSAWIADEAIAGDAVELKAPSGDFYLDESTMAPVVILAAGTGITPFMPMLRRVVATTPDRPIVMFYGNRNSGEQVFREELQEIAEANANFSLIHCFSKPLPGDQPGRDFHVQGKVTMEVIRQILPDRRFQFYLCGPADFMNSLRNGLIEWGIPEGRIRYEAFGPATVVEKSTGSNTESRQTTPVAVEFRDSRIRAECNDLEKSILELAESMSVEINSGCRSGNCGSCAVRLLHGKVLYREQPSAEIDPGYCLACIARPDGPVEVEA